MNNLGVLRKIAFVLALIMVVNNAYDHNVSAVIASFSLCCWTLVTGP